MKTRMLGPGMIQQIQARCSNCNGVGKAAPANDLCSACAGDGLTKERKEFEVVIERGMKDGQKITFQGDAGYSDPEIPPGDVIFIIDAQDHPNFKRVHCDLILQTKISLTQALCGGVITVEQLDGRVLKITPKPGEVIQPDSWHCIRDEGMPIHGSRMVGNLYIRFDVEFPKTVSEDNRRKLITILGAPPEPMIDADVDIEDHDMSGVDDIERELKSRARYEREYSTTNALESDSDEDIGGRQVRCAQQ